MEFLEVGINLVGDTIKPQFDSRACAYSKDKGNLVLQDTVERLFVQNLYADIERGLFLVRGENVLLLGEIDLDKDDYVPEPFEMAPVEKVFALKKAEDLERKRVEKSKHQKLAAFGFEGEHQGEVIL